MNESLKGPVGPGLVNDLQDVSIVQYLLNASNKNRGVPKRRIDVDGIFGPETLAAIKEFQTRFCKLVDGRADPGNETLRQLNFAAGPFVAFSDIKGYKDPSTLRIG
jgi:peptidoglycan hydrolase-like protein with peptidoglycan-binding domain